MKAVASGAARTGQGTHLLCIRPEAVRIGPSGTIAAGAAENMLDGRVVDAVYTAGTLRYQVDAGMTAALSVRMAAVRTFPMLARGQPVTLVWPASATLLIPKE
jgi:putative spermidine/putrescine transport system ATP-binding protein